MAAGMNSPQEERIEKFGGKVVFAVKGDNDRTQKIYDSFSELCPVVDVQRAKFFTESFKETEGETLTLRWAKALYHIAANIDVYVEPDQLIVGRVGQQGKYGLIYPELDGCFLEQFVEQTASREKSPFHVSEEDVRVIKEEIAPYWKGKTYYDELSQSFPEDVLRVTYDPQDHYSSRYIVNESSAWRSALQWVHDYKTGIEKGYVQIKAEAEAALEQLDPFDPAETIDKADFYRAVSITADAIILWAHRHSEKAKALAAKENDAVRKAELLEIARITEKVPAYPAESFYEAVQAQYFLQMFSRIEQKTGATISNGRMDQYLFPYYEKDLKEGRIDREKAKELFTCVWLGMAQYQDLYISPTGANFNEGYAHWEAVTIGGQKEDGSDAANELSYLLLENKREFPLNYPDLAARIHAGSSDEFLKAVAETIKEGSGFPKLLNDEEIVPLLKAQGASEKDARDYAVSGCTEVRMPNLDTFTTACPWINLASILELTLRNGRMKKYGEELLTIETGDPRSFTTYEELEHAFFRQEEYILRMAFKQQYIANRLHAKHFASPFGSSLHALCMKNGQDLHSEHVDGGLEVGFFDFIGYGTAADSLAALKKTVFEDKTLQFEQVLDALDSNFEGAELIRQRLLHAPKYGNNDAYADSIAKKIDRFAVDFGAKYGKYLGVEMDLRYVSQSSNVPFGSVVSATPNGRKEWTALSDGASASQGADTQGPTAVLMSNVATKNADLNNRASRLLNIKMSPASVQGEAGTERLIAFIKTWRDLKLWHLQFNIINQETLYKAQKEPENYRSLLVRVAGYSAYFVQLSPKLQDDIILRTENESFGA
ncbi:MAG: pyruvate formate lyase family protein [Eubacteriales bacterium]|nr:pyruvate formate lyase family protein [Eubacteriales bacterium]